MKQGSQLAKEKRRRERERQSELTGNLKMDGSDELDEDLARRRKIFHGGKGETVK